MEKLYIVIEIDLLVISSEKHLLKQAENITFIGTAITIGIFSLEVVASLAQPFFMALKVINVS